MAKINFIPCGPVSSETIQDYQDYSRNLGLPRIFPGIAGVAAPSLAIVGGSPDIVDHLDTLRNWEGEIWAINGVWQWLYEHGIAATLYAIDPVFHQVYFQPWLNDVKQAVLGDFVHPTVFQKLNKAQVEVVWFGEDANLYADSAATTAPFFVCWRGHKHITYFGCSCSFSDQTHIYKNYTMHRIWVQCGGKEYITTPQFIIQAETMAKIARQFPEYVTIAGVGFLPALVKHGDYDVTHISASLNESINNERSEDAQVAIRP